MITPGTKAPAFSLESDGGKKVALADFKGSPVVVYFYPKDDTPGCTREAIAFTGAVKALAKLGAKVVGISRDSVATHGKFRDKYKLGIALLSDPTLEVHKAYGAFGEKTMYGKKVEGVIRSTFVIGADGKVEKVFPSVKVDGHVEKVIEALGGASAKPEAKSAAPAKKTAAKKSAAKK